MIRLVWTLEPLVRRIWVIKVTRFLGWDLDCHCWLRLTIQSALVIHGRSTPKFLVYNEIHGKKWSHWKHLNKFLKSRKSFPYLHLASMHSMALSESFQDRTWTLPLLGSASPQNASLEHLGDMAIHVASNPHVQNPLIKNDGSVVWHSITTSILFKGPCS